MNVCCHPWHIGWDELSRRSNRIIAVLAAILPCHGVARGVLLPSGPVASRIANLWWVMFWIAAVISVIVFGLLLFAVFKRNSGAAGRRDTEPGSAEPPPWATPFIVVSGIILPTLILLGLLIYSLGTSAVLAAPSGEGLTIEVVGHQWWWEVRYPDGEVVTANEIHIPMDTAVRLELTAADVIHSFWIPTLAGKLDLVPGQTNTLWLEADEPGIYRGRCAEFCGLQHAHMNFLMFADSAEVFAGWLREQQEIAPIPTSPLAEEGLQVFLGSACVNCHTIRGTVASGQLGPDLTHLNSRSTLGAATVANNHGNLAGWIVNSQTIKPGNRMPPMNLEADDLQALVAYLETLD